jgi:hypothetical protein
MTRGCDKVNCQCTYINLFQSSLQAGVERLYIILVGPDIYGGGYKLTDMKSGLDKIWVVPKGLCDP